MVETASFADSRPVDSSPTELYTRIARGALTCWFGSNGPLKDNYVYQAEAEPQSKGGRAEILIRQRDASASNPRGVRAFSVAIRPSGERAEMEIVNHRLPQSLAAEFTGDAERWAAGDVGCRDIARGADWTPSDPANETPKPATKKSKLPPKKN